MTKHIHDFVNDLQPVRVVVPIYVRLIRWMIVALVTIGVCLAAFGFRWDLHNQLLHLPFLIELTIVIGMIFLVDIVPSYYQFQVDFDRYIVLLLGVYVPW